MLRVLMDGEVEYSPPKEHYGCISSLDPAYRFISEAGSLGSPPCCDKSLEHRLLGKLSEALKNCYAVHMCCRRRERECQAIERTRRSKEAEEWCQQQSSWLSCYHAKDLQISLYNFRFSNYSHFTHTFLHLVVNK